MRCLILIVLMLSAGAVSAAEYGIDLFGRSYHGNMPTGERRNLNEANLGFGIHATHYTGKHAFVAEVGTYKNSFYDQVYWVGGQYRYRLFKHLEIGVMARHWESAHDTYPDNKLYKLISVPVIDKVRVQFMTFGSFSGAVVSVSLDM